MSNVQMFNQDCLLAMKEMPDKAFELAIVDPPYGIGLSKGTSRAYKGGKAFGKIYNSNQITGDWDFERPTELYFKELKRVSNNQIIWGGNYFLDYLTPTPCIIVWDKQNGNSFFADGEMAWSSFQSKLRIFHYLSCGFMGDNVNRDKRFHPTQKPVALYQWLLKNYAKPGDKILDTHLGSGSSAIAADIMGFDFVGYEIDRDYYEAALERFNRHKQQTVLEFV